MTSALGSIKNLIFSRSLLAGFLSWIYVISFEIIEASILSRNRREIFVVEIIFIRVLTP